MKRTFNGVLGIGVTSVLSIFICELVILSICPNRVPRCGAWAHIGSALGGAAGAPSCSTLPGHYGTRARVPPPCETVECICLCSELAVPEAVSRHHRRL